MTLDLKEFLPGYLAEVEELLTGARANMLAVETATEKGEAAPKPVRELFRSLHTIKGLSGMIGVQPIVDIAHAMESVLRTADKNGGMLGKGSGEVLVRGLRAIDDRIGDLGAGRAVRSVPTGLIDALNAIVPAVNTKAESKRVGLDPELAAKLNDAEAHQIAQARQHKQRALRVDFSPSRERSERGLTISTVRERIGKIAEIVKIVPRPSPSGVRFTIVLLTAADDAAIALAAEAESSEVTEIFIEDDQPDDHEEQRMSGNFVRVDVSRLDDALEKLSALVVTRFRLGRALQTLKERGADVRELSAILQENARGLRDLRGSIMRARMVSVEEMLDRVPLLVRGLSMSTKKNVRAEIDAGRTELDKSVAERLFPAIVHLVRNAVDHGIEPEEVRKKLGKPEVSIIRVSGKDRGTNRLELTIEDDGAGIDREALAAKAGRPIPANDAELLDLIAISGLSTKDRATETSGRGLGADIVRRIVRNELGGELELSSVPGRGTKFTIRVPLTITIVDAFSFACGESPFVVPVSMVEEIVDLESPDEFFVRRGEVVSLVRLRELFQLDGKAVAKPKAILVRRNSELYAFLVDRMIGREEIVVRPLEDPLVRIPGITGSTDLGDGRPTLVLDLVALSAVPKEVSS